jgi:hypothetical protein
MRHAILAVGMILPILGTATCAKPAPGPVSVPVLTIEPVDTGEPHYFTLPDKARDVDYLCDIASQIATCASVAEVKIFLTTRRAGPEVKALPDVQSCQLMITPDLRTLAKCQ